MSTLREQIENLQRAYKETPLLVLDRQTVIEDLDDLLAVADQPVTYVDPVTDLYVVTAWPDMATISKRPDTSTGFGPPIRLTREE